MKNEKELKEEKEEKRKHRALHWVGLIGCMVLLPIFLINLILIIESFANPGAVPGVLGLSPMIVVTDSMNPEIESGDMIIVRKVNAESVTAGDVIAFFDPTDPKREVVMTHRVQEVTKYESGGLAWRTKGDANNTADPVLIPGENLVGTYKMKIPYLGKIALFMRTVPGLLLCVFLPLVLLIGTDLVRQNLMDKRREKENEELRAEIVRLTEEKEKKGIPAASHGAVRI